LRAVEHRTRPSTRSGCCRQTSCAIAPPIEYPTGMQVSMPRTSSTAATSSAQSSKRKRGEWIPRPCQRWSNSTTR